jgi:hypothetical protein
VAGRIAALVWRLQHRAAQLDATAAFPAQEIAALHAASVAILALSVEVDRSPDETPTRADRLAAVLVPLGLGSLAVGRIVEARTNARQLIAPNGASDQRLAAAGHARNGELFALWGHGCAGEWLAHVRHRDGNSPGRPQDVLFRCRPCDARGSDRGELERRGAKARGAPGKGGTSGTAARAVARNAGGDDRRCRF